MSHDLNGKKGKLLAETPPPKKDKPLPENDGIVWETNDEDTDDSEW